MILKLSYAHIALLILPLIPLLPQGFFLYVPTSCLFLSFLFSHRGFQLATHFHGTVWRRHLNPSLLVQGKFFRSLVPGTLEPTEILAIFPGP